MEIPQRVYSYPVVGTPEILRDIKELLLCNHDAHTLNTQWRGFTENKQEKFTVVAERVEFVQNLELLRQEIAKCQRPASTQIRPTGGRYDDRKIIWECKFMGYDFAGVPFDIAALQIYLLATCIDTFAGQPKYVDSFKWLAEKVQNGAALTVDTLAKCHDEYNREFGLSRLFKRTFCSALLNATLKELWLRNCCVVAIDGPKGGDTPARINIASWEAWTRKADEIKIASIAAALYELRSKFTHCSAREFRRDQPVEGLPVGREKHLVRIGDTDLYELMWATVKMVADQMWLA